jgi:two-component system cell cycle sensor histidine kinase/response regulator CckA
MPFTAMSVLLVEDDDAFADFLVAGLVSFAPSLRMDRARTLDEAIPAIARMSPDVVLLDLELPDSSGLATLDRILQASAEVPVVILAAQADDRLAAEAVHRGAQDYLVKGNAEPEVITRSFRYARERAAFRRALRSSEEELRQVHKMEAVGRLAGGIAHDFNNVLTAIFGYVDLLLDQIEDDDPRRRDVLEIRRSAERAAALTRQLLAFSRKQVMQLRVLDLHDVVLSLEKLLARLVGEDITLKIATSGELWPVKADPGQIEQVLMNLTANARDAMPEGGVLDVRTANEVVEYPDPDRRPGLRPGRYVTLMVSDTGQGMPEHVRRHVFEPFFTTKEQGKGTGLGLATVYGIVNQSGGSVYADSSSGGSRFVIYLPAIENGGNGGRSPRRNGANGAG